MPFPTRLWRRTVSVVLVALSTTVAGLSLAPSAQASDIVTPGSFTGYAFDQCVAPTQSAMDTWLQSSPYWAVGIYLSGDSRGCRYQPNLSPGWVHSQLEKGWRLLPITLGPQASCTTVTRYRSQVRINADPSRAYTKARAQGRAEAAKTVTAAKSLGIAAGSTLWYDIEGFNTGYTSCRESALSFLSAWTNKLHGLGYVSGIYSSGSTGIRMLDDAQAIQPGRYAMPDQLWVADWNGRATVSSSYLRASSWTPHKRVHQYLGNQQETYGGVRIAVDRNFLDLGTGSRPRPQPRHCGDVRVDFADYSYVRPSNRGPLVAAAQCLLREKRLYDGAPDGIYDAGLGAVVKKYRLDHGLTGWRGMSRPTWMALLSQGGTPLMKYGSAASAVRRVQRALNAADSAGLAVTGVFEATTTAAVKRYQSAHRLPVTGVVTTGMWRLVQAGAR